MENIEAIIIFSYKFALPKDASTSCHLQDVIDVHFWYFMSTLRSTENMHSN